MGENILLGKELVELSQESPVLSKHLIGVLAGNEQESIALVSYYELLSATGFDPAISKAFLFALERHKGQYYRWKNGTNLPYAYHLCKAALNGVNLFGARRQNTILALWHDMMEDKRANKEEVRRELRKKVYGVRCPENIVDALALLDRGCSKSSAEYFARLTQSDDAIAAKAADIISNLDACIGRFGEMMKTRERFTIFGYLIEVPEYFLKAEGFLSSPIPGK